MPTPKKANDPKTLPGEDTSTDDTVTTNTDDATEPIATYDEAGAETSTDEEVTTSTDDEDDKVALVAERNDPSDDKVARELAERAKTHDDRPTSSTEPPVVVDNAVDLFAAADTGPRRQGNAYGISRDAVENFKCDAERDRDAAEAEVERLNKVIDDYEQQLSDADVPEGDNTNLNIAKQAQSEVA